MVPVAHYAPLALGQVVLHAVEEVVAEDALAQVHQVALLLRVHVPEVQPVLQPAVVLV